MVSSNKSIGIICCKVLEKEVKHIAQNLPAVTHLEVMEWGLHAQPDLLSETLSDRIDELQDKVHAVVLGYGRCQALDKIPSFNPIGPHTASIAREIDPHRFPIR